MERAGAACWDVRDGAVERDWRRAHAALTRLARERAAADAEEGRWLLLAWRSGAHVHLGQGSLAEYVERLLGYSPRATREKLRVAEALERLPQSARALERGALSWCAARELTRVATADTEAAWLEIARGKTTRQIEALVAGKQPGELPPDPAHENDLPPPRRQVLRFEVSPETFASFREAMQNLRRSAGSALDDDALLLAMARQTLGTSSDGRSSYRITYQVCAACGRGAQVSGGELVAVTSEVLAMASCDGESIRLQPAGPAMENSSAAANEAEAATPRAAHVGRTLCSAHHRATHRGELIVGTTAHGLTFQHADGTAYGEVVMASSVDAHAKVFGALRNLGFREGEARAALAELCSDASLRDAPTSYLLREALRRMQPATR